MNLRSLRGITAAAALGVTAALGGLATDAHAGALAGLTLEQKVDASTYIVRGTVTEVWSVKTDDGQVWTRARLDVSETMKGPDAPSELVVDSIGGWWNGQLFHAQLGARYSQGEELVVFLDKISGERLTPVEMYRGKYTIRRAPGESRKHVVQYHVKPHAAYDHRFLPHPSPSDRLYLDDLVDGIAGRLRTGWDGESIPGISTERLAIVNAPDRRTRR